MKVAVLMGGRSAEREISLRTGQGIAQRAARAGPRRDRPWMPPTARLLPAGERGDRGAPGRRGAGACRCGPQVGVVDVPAVREADIVYIALHGTFGEDGRIQALLELAGKRYTGSGVLASALAMDKAMSKRMFVHDGVPTPRWSAAPRRRAAGRAGPRRPAAGCPVVVKPNEEGSSVGAHHRRARGRPRAGLRRRRRSTATSS